LVPTTNGIVDLERTGKSSAAENENL
jgi:hypothetical protein